MENKTNIVKAILAVMQEVKNIDKAMTVGSGNNTYKGVADKDVKNIIGGAMAKHGLVALPISIEPTTKVDRWEETNNYGTKAKQSVFTEVKTRYLLMHESGESIEIEGLGHGVDPQDKAAGKATTYALKNALLYSFLVPTGQIDDTDATHSDDIQTPPVQKKSSPAAQQPKERKELKPGTEGWNKALTWLVANPTKAHTIKLNYDITDADFDALLALAKEQSEAASTSVEVPVETLDAIKSASDMKTLNRIYNECTDLHVSRVFTEAYASRQKELAKLGKAA